MASLPVAVQTGAETGSTEPPAKAIASKDTIRHDNVRAAGSIRLGFEEHVVAHDTAALGKVHNGPMAGLHSLDIHPVDAKGFGRA
jgi:hypothetical protein